MANSEQMEPQDSALESFKDDVLEGGYEDELPNPERGCGHLDSGSAYLRGSLPASTGGVLPAFVRCDPPIPYREIGTDGSFTRSYEEIDGLTMQIAVEGDVCEFTPLAPETEYERTPAFENMVTHGLYGTQIEIPDSEVDRHIDRVRAFGAVGDHWGEIEVCGQTDLLMRAGESYYPDPEDYIEETRKMGLSKKIPLRKGNAPTVVPGVTRCWIMHPNAVPEGEYGGGIIGYAYLSRTVFTEPEEGDVPQYVKEMEQTGKLDIVDIAEPETDDEDDKNASLEDFDLGGDDSEDDAGDDDDEITCECGDTFDSLNALAGHKTHCNAGGDE